MKRAGVLSEDSLDQPRRSKRLAKAASSNVNKNAVPSVVSISSNEGSSNSNNTVNNRKPPPVQVVFRNFPQDAIQQVNAMLPIFTEHIQDDAASNDSSDDDTTTHERQQKYIQMKECIFRICKFALLEESFLGKDEETRQVQATAMNILVYSSPMNSSRQHKELELVETFLQVLIARGNILPPKSLHLFQQSHEELWQEIDKTVGRPQNTTTLEERFTTFLMLQGEKLIDLHNSKIQISNHLFRHDFHSLTQTVELIQVQRAIVQLWIQLLQDGRWNACQKMRMEQLENAHAALEFCKRVLLSREHDLKTLDVKMLLWKLVLYCSYAMDWPADDCSRQEKEVLKRLCSMVRR